MKVQHFCQSFHRFIEFVIKTFSSTKVWLDEVTWNPWNPGQVLRVNHPRALNISRRIERAVKMNTTSQYASLPIQVLKIKDFGLFSEFLDASRPKILSFHYSQLINQVFPLNIASYLS